MAAYIRDFQAGTSTHFLRNVALVTALFALASAAHAEVVTLLCQVEAQPGSTFTLKVDYDRKTVADEHYNSTPGTAVPATITESEVTWDHINEHVEVFEGNWGRFQFAGSLNRLSGQGRVTYWRMDTSQPSWSLSGPCRRATQKF
ncbi:MAG: hypothetical protein PSX71_08495 [bacterium]|nr:hypothetical protein [bacterium]